MNWGDGAKGVFDDGLTKEEREKRLKEFGEEDKKHQEKLREEDRKAAKVARADEEKAELLRLQEEEQQRRRLQEEDEQLDSTALAQSLMGKSTIPSKKKVAQPATSTRTIHDNPLYQSRREEIDRVIGNDHERRFELEQKAQRAVKEDFNEVVQKVLEAEFSEQWNEHRFNPEYQQRARVVYEGILPPEVLQKMEDQFGIYLEPEALRRVARAYTYLQEHRRATDNRNGVVSFEIVPTIALVMYFIAQKEILFQMQGTTPQQRRADKEYQQALQLFDRYLSPRRERTYAGKKREILPEKQKGEQFERGSLKSIVQVLDETPNNPDDFDAGYRAPETRAELCRFLVDPMPDLAIKLVTKDDHARDDALEGEKRMQMLQKMAPEDRNAYIEERSRRIAELNKGIVEVNELFVKMAEIVHGQWENVNSIYAKTDTALTLTREGYWEIVAAYQAQKGHLFQSFMTSLYKGRTFLDRNIDKTCEAIWDNRESSLIQKIRQIMAEYRDSLGSRNHRDKAVNIITALDALDPKGAQESQKDYVERVSSAVTLLLDQYIGAIAKSDYSSFRMRCKFIRNHLDFARENEGLISERERTKRWRPPM